MRIAMLVNNLDVSGGYHKLVLRLGHVLIERGHDVTIYTGSINRDECYPELLSGIAVRVLEGFGTQDSGHRRLWRKLLSGVDQMIRFREVGKMVPAQVDAIIIHDELSLYALSAIAIHKSVAVVWMLNNELSEGVNSLAFRLRGLLSISRSLRDLATRVSRFAAALVEWRNCQRGIRKVDVVAVYDEFNRRAVTQRLGIPAKNVIAGADIEDFCRLRGQPSGGRQVRRVRILSVGVMFPHRRYEDLIKGVALALRRGVDVELTIVGRPDLSPSYVNTIRALPEELGCSDRIAFRGAVSTSELHELYRDAGAFAFVNDGLTWGISVFEAIAADLPVIVTNNVGAADLLNDRKSAWLVEPRQPEQIAAALEEIVSKPEMVARVTGEARERVLPVVSWDAYADRMLDVIKEVRNG
jgi:glycosyltransferase involved in cell wall biosynthesis